MKRNYTVIHHDSQALVGRVTWHHVIEDEIVCVDTMLADSVVGHLNGKDRQLADAAEEVEELTELIRTIVRSPDAPPGGDMPLLGAGFAEDGEVILSQAPLVSKTFHVGDPLTATLRRVLE